MLDADTQKFLSFLEDYFNKIHQHIYIEEKPSHSNENNIFDAKITRTVPVYYNNDDYLSEPSSEIGRPDKHKLLFNQMHLVKGAPLKHKQTPIGYNVHFPAGSVQGAYFVVYGGTRSSFPSMMPNDNAERRKVEWRNMNGNAPGELQPIEKYLLENGIAVITLNLPDILELEVFQAFMPESLHTKIHECIHAAFSAFKNNPELLHPDLITLKGKRMVLSGTSFGGRTAVMQAELHPNTFDGYVTFEGALSLEALESSDLPFRVRPAGKWQRHLDPAQANLISQIAQPTLIVQNRDDNNVNLKVAIDFYNRMEKINKSDLVRLLIIDRGNSSPYNKGHGLPENLQDLYTVASVVSQFTREGPSELTALHEWRAFRQNKLADRFYTKASLEDKFISEAMDLPLPTEFRKSRKNVDELWDDFYKPLYLIRFFSDKISKDPSVLGSEITHLHETLSSQEINNVLRAQKNIFKDLIQDFHQTALSDQEFETALQRKSTIDFYKELVSNLSKQSPGYTAFFLKALYNANPQLLKHARYQELGVKYKVQNHLPNAKTLLDSVFHAERRRIRSTWKQAALKAGQKKSFTTPYNNPSNRPKKS